MYMFTRTVYNVIVQMYLTKRIKGNLMRAVLKCFAQHSFDPLRAQQEKSDTSSAEYQIWA